MASDLEVMFDELRDAPELFQPSAFWEHYNALNVRQLEQHGFQDFKRTLGRNYFTFLPPRSLRDAHFLAVMRPLLTRPVPQVLTAKLDVSSHPGDEASGRRLRMHALYVAALWELVRRRDSIGLLERLREPEAGNPLLVRHRGRLITEDLCNSALEALAIVEGLGGEPPGPGGILEIGGGYGRLSWALLEAFPGLRCVMVDVPPALAVAERYMAELYPERRIFRFRHFDDGDEVAEELAQAELAFLTPNQLDLIPPLGVAGVVNVSSFHEMRRDQIDYYIREAVPRHAPDGFLYMKQWRRSENHRDGIVVRQEDYPVPDAWERVYERTHPVQVDFFEGFYRVRGGPLPRAEHEAAPEAPTLSICIPTHDGRAAALAELLDSIGRQARPGLEVTVSDNASTDGVAAVVEAFRERYGVPTAYGRTDPQVGVGPNILRAIELASGDYAWPVGSDDHLAPEAVERVFALLSEHPGVSGITTRRDNFSADMTERLEPDPPGFYPEPVRTTRLKGTSEVLGNLGQAFAFLGVHVLHRERFLIAAREGVEDALAHPLWPQIQLFGRVVLRDPLWVWYPTPLIKSRSHSSYILTTGEAGDDLGSIHAHVVNSLDAVWRDLIPRGFGDIRAALLRRALLVWANPHSIAIIKSRPEHSLATDARMLVAFTRSFWRLPEFWRGSFGALLVPYPLARVLAWARRRLLPRSEPLSHEEMRTRVVAAVEGPVPVRSMLSVQARVTNTGQTTLVSAPPNPVHVSYQWLDPDNGELHVEGMRTTLKKPLAPGETAEVTLRLLTPWEPGEYRLRITPVQELVAWFGDVDPGNALELTVRAAPHDDL
jgi:putative sugar O-methyltransferase